MGKALQIRNTCIKAYNQNLTSKPEELPDMADVDDDFTRFLVSTKVFKVFNDVKYKGAVTGYDHKKQLYHILYDKGGAEDYYHNEV